MAPSPDDIQAAREQIAEASRRLAAEGLVVGTAGNLSVRVGDAVAVTPTGARLESLQAQDVALVDRGGEQLEGPFAPTSELGLHLGVYGRYDAGAVVHTHAPIATALGCVLEELPVIHYQLLALGGPVRVAPYRTFGSAELAEVTLDALEGRTAAIMANHGAISYGADLEAATSAAELLEWGCALYRDAAAFGTPRALSDDEREAVITAAVERGYGQKQEVSE